MQSTTLGKKREILFSMLHTFLSTARSLKKWIGPRAGKNIAARYYCKIVSAREIMNSMTPGFFCTSDSGLHFFIQISIGLPKPINY